MQQKLIAFLMIAGVLVGWPASAQQARQPWTNLPEASAKEAPASAGSPSLALTSGGPVDLGSVDGDKPVLCQFRIDNHGAGAFSLLVPQGFSASPLRVQVPASAAIPSGGQVEVLVEYDARLNDGPSTFVVALDTDDPAAPHLRQVFTAVVTHQVVVSPHRDLIASADTPVRFFFAPKDGARFITASLEDPEAPIALAGSQDAGTGRLDGVATLDVAKAASAPSQGAVRVVGKTDKGTTAYFWLQWSLQK